VLRREMPESKPGWRARLRDAKPSLAAAGLILCGLGGIAAGSRMERRGTGCGWAAYFIGRIVASLLALAAVAWALLRSLRALLRTSGAARLPANLRHGMANLYRPGNQAQTVLVALGLGVMFSLTIYLCSIPSSPTSPAAHRRACQTSSWWGLRKPKKTACGPCCARTTACWERPRSFPTSQCG